MMRIKIKNAEDEDKGQRLRYGIEAEDKECTG
jgi:hypothetical protein